MIPKDYPFSTSFKDRDPVTTTEKTLRGLDMAIDAAKVQREVMALDGKAHEVQVSLKNYKGDAMTPASVSFSVIKTPYIKPTAAADPVHTAAYELGAKLEAGKVTVEQKWLGAATGIEPGILAVDIKP